MTDDHSLVDKILAGDQQAFRWLIKRYETLIGHVVGRIIKGDEEREEVCQDVFLKIHDKLSTFRKEAKLSTWMVTIAYRMSLNYLEKNKMETVSLSAIGDLPMEQAQLSPLEQEDLKNTLEVAILKLPLSYRVVITLFHLEENTYEEVCAITGMALGTVKSNLFRGRKLLKEIVEKNKEISSYE